MSVAWEGTEAGEDGVERLHALPAVAVAADEPADRVGFDRFYEAQRPRLVTVCLALTSSGAVGEEIAQESLFVAYRRWDHVSTLERPDLWVRRVAVNLCTSAWRRRQAEARANRAHHRSTVATYVVPDTDDALWRAVRDLPGRQRAAVILHYVDQLPTREIGEILGCSASTTQTHLNRGRTALRRVLGDADPMTGEGGR